MAHKDAMGASATVMALPDPARRSSPHMRPATSLTLHVQSPVPQFPMPKHCECADNDHEGAALVSQG